jgi:hypothetical protein
MDWSKLIPKIRMGYKSSEQIGEAAELPEPKKSYTHTSYLSNDRNKSVTDKLDEASDYGPEEEK